MSTDNNNNNNDNLAIFTDPYAGLSPEELCLKDRHWYAFLCSSLITFFTGLLMVLSWRILSWLLCQKAPILDPDAKPDETDRSGGGGGAAVQEGASGAASGSGMMLGGEVGWASEAKDWAGELISGQTTTDGKIEIYTQGLRFTRALRLMTIPDVLQYLNILKTSNSIRLCQLVSTLISVWFTGAGFVHLVETSGDPLDDFSNAQNLTYWECVYFTLVTMSTVGYGDIACKTTLGRLFMVFFILGALAMFASFIPEITDILGNRSKYGGSFKKERGKRHIVLCGHITYESVSNFMSDFLHKDREDVDVELVIMNRKEPDLELESLFKRHFTQVKFFQGTVMDANDLHRVNIKEADACLILANKYCEDPDAEDAANILRVISIKNYFDDIKVIIQLLQYHNKSYLLNIPSWDWKRGDDAVCLAELKLGFIAQSCLACGFSTLLANLFTMRSYKLSPNMPQWQDDYMRGTGMEMYTDYLSPAFMGMTFPEASEVCFLKLKLLLIAVESKSEDGKESNIKINPGPDVRIDASTQGFFFAESADDVKRALYYCKFCHTDPVDIKLVKKCKCKLAMMSLKKVPFLRGPDKPNDHAHFPFQRLDDDKKDKKSPHHISNKKLARSSSINIFNNNNSNNVFDTNNNIFSNNFDANNNIGDPRKFDSTGMFHWCPAQNMGSCVISRDQAAMTVMSNHVVVCLFADAHSAIIGLRNLIMPLRASNFEEDELKHVVLVGDKEYMKKEWKNICNFPKISILGGSPLNRANLRAVHINMCDMCIILSARNSTGEDSNLVDKEAILCSLNIKAMTFDDTVGLLSCQQQRMQQQQQLPQQIQISGVQTTSVVVIIIIVVLVVGTGFLPFDVGTLPSDVKAIKRGVSSGNDIPMITELGEVLTYDLHNFDPRLLCNAGNDANVQFLDQDDDDDPDTELYMTQPFACGTAFAVSVLDSLMSTTYFNDNALTLIRTLITGGATPELEQILAEGVGMRGGYCTPETLDHRNRCRVDQLPLYEGILAQFGVFENFLRFRDSTMTLAENPSAKRFVITNPTDDMQLTTSDKVFCLRPFKIIERKQPVKKKKRKQENTKNKHHVTPEQQQR
ncbi:hypothetical protein HELRODRAFT_168799 [Helobdella robusta]|uniref:RCK N-terminal domain-containing protein n=1 Tax=Helobdella robusta TaxID=6412 RepID=T1F0Z5_HELRO|nr:hypothetical protein HELRODRAFT_168799 [Helobdella robusta]ESO08881.1 hypothetical protein HELRODRAFT_168799 [Helobdella robusta]